jgi:hypothetical protein
MTSDDGLRPGEARDLAEMRFSWGAQYDITFIPPSGWRAQRRDDPGEVHEALTAAGLRQLIRENYWPKGVRKPG